MPQTVDRIDFAFADVDPSQWPKLSCGGDNQLVLESGSLHVEANRELLFQGNGQLRALDDNHRLVFNRAGNLLELHEAGDIRFLTGAPTPTEKLRIRADGKVGIGTDSPTQALEVNGAIKATNFVQGTTPLVSSQWTVVAGGISYVGDRVGIGTTTPTANLHIGKPEAEAGTAGAIDRLILQPYGHTGGPWRVTARDDVNNAYLDLQYASSHLLTVIHNGNIGIGTSAPEGRLDVWGDIRAGNSDLYFTKTDHSHTGLGNTIGYAAIENAADYDALMILGRAGTAQGRKVRLWDYLQVNGNLEVTGSISGRLNGLDVAPAFTARVRCADFVIGGISGRGPERRALVAWETALEINHNGDWPRVTIQNLASGSSQERKENIAQLTLQAAHHALQQLKPVEFSVKTDPEHQVRSGFIAEESPNLVVTSDQKAIFVDGIVAVLTKVVQAQSLEIAALKSQLTALVAQVRDPQPLA